MKLLLSVIFSLVSLAAFSQVEAPKPTKKQWYNSERKFENCEFKGQTMNLVKVRFTTSENAKYKVKIVEKDEDLTVRYITNSWRSDLCGQWILATTDTPDFTVAVVEYGEDFTIRITED
jgi:hypothetical protein